MLVKHKPVGIVSVTGSLIEDLYIRPDEQNKGYGTDCCNLPSKRVRTLLLSGYWKTTRKQPVCITEWVSGKPEE